MHRSILPALLICGLVFSPAASAALKVFACEPEWKALVDELGGDLVESYSATTAHQDVHRIQARPSLIARLRQADLLICTGAGLEEGWLPLLLRRSANGRVQTGQPGFFMAADQVERLDIPTSVDRSMGDIHGEGNPHIHLDPQRLLQIAAALNQRLQALTPAQSQDLQQRFELFKQRWETAIHKWQQQAAVLKGKKVITHHKDWRYLLAWLGMGSIASLEPKPGIPPNASHLAALKNRVREEQTVMILRTGYQDDRPSLWLSERTGIPALSLPYTVGGDEKTTTLFTLFDETIAMMIGTLNNNTPQ